MLADDEAGMWYHFVEMRLGSRHRISMESGLVEGMNPF